MRMSDNALREAIETWPELDRLRRLRLAIDQWPTRTHELWCVTRAECPCSCGCDAVNEARATARDLVGLGTP